MNKKFPLVATSLYTWYTVCTPECTTLTAFFFLRIFFVYNNTGHREYIHVRCAFCLQYPNRSAMNILIIIPLVFVRVRECSRARSFQTLYTEWRTRGEGEEKESFPYFVETRSQQPKRWNFFFVFFCVYVYALEYTRAGTVFFSGCVNSSFLYVFSIYIWCQGFQSLFEHELIPSRYGAIRKNVRGYTKRGKIEENIRIEKSRIPLKVLTSCHSLFLSHSPAIIRPAWAHLHRFGETLCDRDPKQPSYRVRER